VFRPLSRDRRALAAVGAGVTLAVLIVIVVIAAGGGGGKQSAGTTRPAPANAPLAQQLDTLDRMIQQAAGH
jgi:hypothetical protein